METDDQPYLSSPHPIANMSSPQVLENLSSPDILLENLGSPAEDNMSSAQPANVRFVELMGNSTDWRQQLDFPLLQVQESL